MALIDITKESLVSVLRNASLISGFESENPSDRLLTVMADSILNYYTPVVPVSPLLLKPSAFAIKDVISNELIWNFTACMTEKECRILRLRYFPTAQYKVVKLYEAAE